VEEVHNKITLLAILQAKAAIWATTINKEGDAFIITPGRGRV
jgi:hypothetical protein